MVDSGSNKERIIMLPQKVYEALRWIIAVVLPAVSLLIATLATIWGWDIPYENIGLTIDAIALFLGTIFGISKVVNAKR